MLKEKLSAASQKLTAALETESVENLLQPILVAGMQRGFQAAYLYIIGAASGVEAAAQPAAWVDQVEGIANEQFTKVVADLEKPKSTINKEVLSMLSEESHAISAHQGNVVKAENIVMPYFNGWYLGYYHALLTMMTIDVMDGSQEEMAKNASDQAMQAVTVERQSFQKQPVYQSSVLKEILVTLN